MPAYEAAFNTKAGQRQELGLPFHIFTALFRERVIVDAGPLEAADIVFQPPLNLPKHANRT